MQAVQDWKVENVPVTLHLTPEAARILYDYAGERSRGKFVSALLVQQRANDEKEAVAASVAASVAKPGSTPRAKPARRARSGHGRRKRR